MYDATRELFGSYSFASQSVIMAALNNGLVDMAKEYAVAFKESGAIVPSKALLRFLHIGINAGDVETAEFGHQHYLEEIARLNAFTIDRVKERNTKIESGEEEGPIRDISQLQSTSSPRSPFFHTMTACMRVLQGDVPAATAALNDLVIIQSAMIASNGGAPSDAEIARINANVIDLLTRWPKTLYGSGYDAKPRDELRDALKSAIAGVTEPSVKDLLSAFDVDAAFAENVDATASEASSE